MQKAKNWVCDNEDDIKEMIEYWRPKLGITDWVVELEVKNQIDVHNRGMAASHWLLSRRVAWIDLSRSSSRQLNTLEDDAEMSLVHELLHVTFAAWHNSSDPNMGTGGVEYDTCCEQPIDQLAETLVLLRRSIGHRFSFEQ